MNLKRAFSVPSKSCAHGYRWSRFGASNKVQHRVPKSSIWGLHMYDYWSKVLGSGMAVSCKEDATHNDNNKWKDCWFPRSKYVPKYSTMLSRVWSRAGNLCYSILSLMYVDEVLQPILKIDQFLVGHLSATYLEHWACLLQSAVQSIKPNYNTTWNQAEACKFGRRLRWGIWTRTCAWSGGALVPHICELMFKFKPEFEINSLHQPWNLETKFHHLSYM